MGRGKVNGEEREAEEMKVEDEKERRELNFHSKLFFSGKRKINFYGGKFYIYLQFIKKHSIERKISN